MNDGDTVAPAGAEARLGWEHWSGVRGRPRWCWASLATLFRISSTRKQTWSSALRKTWRASRSQNTFRASQKSQKVYPSFSRAVRSMLRRDATERDPQLRRVIWGYFVCPCHVFASLSGSVNKKAVPLNSAWYVFRFILLVLRSYHSIFNLFTLI